MNPYDKYILPRIIHFVCQMKSATEEREKIVPLASGRVLEIGIGSGLNLPLYNPALVSEVIGIDPAEELWHLHNVDTGKLGFPFSYLPVSAEQIPLENASIDTALSTYTLCSIGDLPAALAEIRRVLKPEGRLLICEHGTAPEPGVQRWQNGLNPAWKYFGGGCHLNRNIAELLEDNGFYFVNLEAYYLPGWKPFSYHYTGEAKIKNFQNG